MEESRFQTLAETTLLSIADAIENTEGDTCAEIYDGVLTIESEEGITFLINKHSPLKQLWLSSPVSGGSHYSWNETLSAWISVRNGDELKKILITELSETINITITFDK